MWKKIKIINKNKKKLGKLLRKLLYGENSIQASMIKWEIIYKNHWKMRPIKQELPKKPQMIICFKLEMEKSMALILIKKLTVKLDN